MAYQVFARKYRPQTFSEVVGQEAVIRTLTNALRLGRIAQAYLFVGPRGTGKTSTARILAKALQAQDGPRADFNPDEEICREIAEGRCLDVLEIDGASNNSVEQVRDLRDNVRYTPAKGRFKIYIIDEVHMLSNAAFNALLKTLEEPPAHVKFIFATTEVHKVPATILSRCQRFDLRRISELAIRDHLARICSLENVKAEPGALQTLARYAEGGMRDAESALDQAISFYGDSVFEEDVLSLFGLTGFGPVGELGRALALGDAGAVLGAARRLVEAGKDLGKLSQDLLGFFRNVVICQVSPGALDQGLPPHELVVVTEVAGLVSRNAALDILEQLSQLESRLRYALAKDVIFEAALIQMSQLRSKVSLDEVLRALTNDSASCAMGGGEGEKTERPSMGTSREQQTAQSPGSPQQASRLEAPADKPERVGSGRAGMSTEGKGEKEGEDRLKKDPVFDGVKASSTALPQTSLNSALSPEQLPTFAQTSESLGASLTRASLFPAHKPDQPQFSSTQAGSPIPAGQAGASGELETLSILTGADAQAAWNRTVALFQAERPLEAETIGAVEFFALKSDAMEVTLPPALEKKLYYLRSPRNRELLEKSLSEQLRRPIRIIFIIGESRNSRAASAGQSPSNGASAGVAGGSALPGKPVPPPPAMKQEDFVNDPVIQHALKIFEAKIITTSTPPMTTPLPS